MYIDRTKLFFKKSIFKQSHTCRYPQVQTFVLKLISKAKITYLQSSWAISKFGVHNTASN